MRSFIFLLFIFCEIAIAQNSSQLPSVSIAVSDSALATIFNPAGLSQHRGSELVYLRSLNGDLRGDDALFISTANTGFGLEFVEDRSGVSFNRYTTAAGGRLFKSLYFGTSYSWINASNKNYYRSKFSDYDNFSSISIGLLFRRRNFSIGAVGRDLNRPALIGARTYELGFAIRPQTNRIMFSLDLRKTEKIDELQIRYGLEIRPIDHLSFHGNYHSDKNFDLRFGVHFGQFDLSTFNTFSADRKYQSTIAQLRLTQIPQTRRKRKIYLDLHADEIDQIIPKATSDATVIGAIIHLGDDQFGIAETHERLELIKNFKSEKKEILVYAESISTKNYLLSSHADQIILHPLGTVDLIGLRSEQIYLKSAFRKFGIDAEFERIGEYKSMPEMFQRKKISSADLEQTNAILDDLYDRLVAEIADGRDRNADEVKSLIDLAPFTAKSALENRIVDRLLHRDEFDELINEKTQNLITADQYLRLKNPQHDWQIPKPKIVVINAIGDMLTGKSFSNPIFGVKIMGADTIADAIQKAREDKNVRAVVLRIDSGGGAVLAADIIWRELQLLKNVKKPLIVSMGNVAASGGYYIAAPADLIIAQPTTITGSIGVFSGKFNFRKMLKKIGVRKTILKRGENADIYSTYSKFDRDQKKILQNAIAEIYDDFITKVADGRGMTKSEVDEIARGRIWSGESAIEIGLVDELGGEALAIERAIEKAKLTRSEVEIIRLPIERSFFSRAISFSAWQKIIDRLQKTHIFFMMPYGFEILD